MRSGIASTDEWRSWPRESRTFSGLAAERSGEFTRLGGQVLHTRLVSANYFQVLRVPMAMGRTLTPDDASDAAVISYELWQRRFRTDPDIVGRSIALDSVPNPLETEHVTVIGVAAEEFNGTDPTLLAFTAAVASYAPTRRALRIEPIKALRVD